ncbi:P-loop containing nucleoside triphosphate hydrolase protein [Metschnikowia bicuspidata var. bicuspidata NRRL YB-4993]|uniref:p-loop containing nucleoside triphosphate hydrolase protein n=1 Tax=Metschnikowia bicuspidata var. bicuspidata NRRL YB-4993 TaxID=869754 RepID=A0A1A0H681_9ASCO|nr:P-loop containing nucleoside triphosphate hydrolase protein [Metschnikowia bicuspidata var. bicuspidata NRRL YB-4993]OBA19423.1 P-loop containing nucleoside triphosphate hydrolase protein [Metschnikowia bicuspidata var. bicuspidata NRRL YB-4993]
MKLVLVGISGPSSSGKSTVVKGLVSVLPRCTEIHLDDFYLPDSQIPIDKKHGVQNWDCAEALDWEKFKGHLESVRASNGALLPVESLEMELELSLSEQQRKTLRARICGDFPWLRDCHVVLVDGFMLFHDASVSALLDVKILFRAPYTTLKKRRELRQGYNTVEGFWSDPPGYFDKIVWPAYVESHGHLFSERNVESSLAESATQMGISDIRNDGGRDLPQLVALAVESIAKATRQGPRT